MEETNGQAGGKADNQGHPQDGVSQGDGGGRAPARTAHNNNIIKKRGRGRGRGKKPMDSHDSGPREPVIRLDETGRPLTRQKGFRVRLA